MLLVQKLMSKALGENGNHRVTLRRNIRVPAADGVDLLTDLYLSSDGGSEGNAAPVIMIRSPYGKGAMLASGTAYPLATHGYNVVMQTCRGMFGSGGEFDPHHDDQRDGLATIEWIKQQPWYGGAIATYGMSYLGYTQWAVAAPAGPEVRAMAMQVTVSNFANMNFSSGSLMLENALTWTNMITAMRTTPRFAFIHTLTTLTNFSMIRKKSWQVLPLASMDEKVAGKPVKFWQDWLNHSSPQDPWWQPMDHSNAITEGQRPISMVAGWYDIFTPWQLQDFTALQAAGCEARITIGPWRHTDTELGQTGLRDTIDWFDQQLRGQPPRTPRKAVRLYVIGAEEWREFDNWPPRETTIQQWYLQPQKQLLQQLPPPSEADRYLYDPVDPTPAVGGPALNARAHSIDNSSLESRKDVLTFTSEPLAEPCDIIGQITAQLFISSSAASADFFVRLCEVDSEGVSKNICDGLQRVAVATEGEAQQVNIELWPTAWRIARGHRLRVQVSSGAFPRWARNPGTAEPLGSAQQLQVAQQSIYHSPDYPSLLQIPVVAATDSSAVDSIPQ